MTRPPEIFDQSALQMRRARAAFRPVDFLHEEAAGHCLERLLEVNRTFTKPAIIGPKSSFWRELLKLDGESTVCRPDRERIDLEPDTHDLAIHALSLHNNNDPVGQLIQMRHALRTDGLMLCCLFGGRSLHELRSCLAEAEIAVSGGLSPRVSPMGELRDLGGLLQRAGFALPVADVVSLKVTYANLSTLMADLRGMAETNILQARVRHTTSRKLFERAEAIYREQFSDADGRLVATVELVFLTGWKPGAGQQQPLKPGSATMRLVDALDEQRDKEAD